MRNCEGWRDLFKCEDHDRARTIATCVEAMEFESSLDRLDYGVGRRAGTQWTVRVREEHWDVLAEVIDEIILEQEEFDDFLDNFHSEATRSQQRVLIVMVAIVGSLAAIGAIKL